MSAGGLFGELARWPTKELLAELLNDAGLRTTVGRYSVRVEDCSHFVFQQYGGDLGDPVIDADADSFEDMMRDARRVSDALSAAGIRHRFEVEDDEGRQGYLHHDWSET